MAENEPARDKRHLTYINRYYTELATKIKQQDTLMSSVQIREIMDRVYLSTIKSLDAEQIKKQDNIAPPNEG
jgi:hypothetical protein